MGRSGAEAFSAEIDRTEGRRSSVVAQDVARILEPIKLRLKSPGGCALIHVDLNLDGSRGGVECQQVDRLTKPETRLGVEGHTVARREPSLVGQQEGLDEGTFAARI